MVVCRLSFIKRTLSTVDASELYKFKKLGTKWAHDNEEFRLLRLMNPLRIDYICRHYGRDLRNTRILDVGTGGGLLALPLARLGAKVMGIDACMESICAAEMLSRDVIKRESLNLSYKTCTIGIYFSLRIPYNNLDDIEEFGTFDIIVASEVLEHVRDPEEFLRACSHKLGSEGMIFVSTINDTLMARLLVVEAAEKFLKIVPEGTHDPQKFVSIERLRRITKSLGPQFTISEVQGVAYFPILSQWRRVPTTAANYFAIIRKNKNSNKS